MILYIDTESDPITKQPLTVQYRYGGEDGVISEFNDETYTLISSMWRDADAVIMFNAPYDLGVLSIAWPRHNSYEWTDTKHGQYWKICIFGCAYRVRRISGFRNLIKPLARTHDDTGRAYQKKASRPASTPVIDLLKLWSILVDDGEKRSISLNALIERELHRKAIPYTPENAKTLEYQLQDVRCLEELWHIFLEKVSNIEAVRGYSYEQWAYVKTPATFTKIAYEEEYSDLKMWQAWNNEQDRQMKLAAALEQAYHGGITVALKRGVSNRTAWFDINGAYAHVIEYENTDRYLCYTWKEADPAGYELARDGKPALCHVRTDAVLDTIAKSLKIYRLKRPTTAYMWGYDILALRALFPGCRIEINKVYELEPLVDVSESLPARWSAMKEEEERLHGKTTRRAFFKLLCNTSYGIKAQREPFTTIHTNMAVAGLITARAHLILCEMIDEARRHGCRWIYSDTDSICVEHEDVDIAALSSAINARIAPYTAECEGYDRRTRILSLKRYTSTGGRNIDGSIPANKIRLHGRGQYKVSQEDIWAWTEGADPGDMPLRLTSIAANTQRTMNRVLSLNPLARSHIHPFAFETDIRSDRSAREWFSAWFAHIDTKTSYEEGADVWAEFYRDIRTFESAYHAHSFYNAKIVEDEDVEAAVSEYIDWDREDAYAFDSPPPEDAAACHVCR